MTLIFTHRQLKFGCALFAITHQNLQDIQSEENAVFPMPSVHLPNNNNYHNSIRGLQACADNNNSSNSNIIINTNQWIAILSIESHQKQEGTEVVVVVQARVCTQRWVRTVFPPHWALSSSLSRQNPTFTNNRCQFHRHFKISFFVQKCFELLFFL
jgi:hypothetical protein